MAGDDGRRLEHGAQQRRRRQDESRCHLHQQQRYDDASRPEPDSQSTSGPRLPQPGYRFQLEEIGRFSGSVPVCRFVQLPQSARREHRNEVERHRE